MSATESARRWNNSTGTLTPNKLKLTQAERQDIRDRHDNGETIRSLAATYGISKGSVFNIIHSA